MIKILVENQRDGMRCLTDKTGGGNKIAVPPREPNGMFHRVEVNAVQFRDCKSEVQKLVRRGVLKLFASNGQVTEEVSFVAVEQHFSKPGPKPEPLPVQPLPVQPPQQPYVAPHVDPAGFVAQPPALPTEPTSTLPPAPPQAPWMATPTLDPPPGVDLGDLVPPLPTGVTFK